MRGNVVVVSQSWKSVTEFSFSKTLNTPWSLFCSHESKNWPLWRKTAFYHISVLDLSFNVDMLGTWISSLKCRIITKSKIILIVMVYTLQAHFPKLRVLSHPCLPHRQNLVIIFHPFLPFALIYLKSIFPLCQCWYRFYVSWFREVKRGGEGRGKVISCFHLKYPVFPIPFPPPLHPWRHISGWGVLPHLFIPTL